MTTRRTFIKALGAIPPAFSCNPGWTASGSPSRLALIIGNGAYRDAPLLNPVNDAKAVAGLFTRAGFAVDSHLNATRTVMLDAIERFSAEAKRPETKLVIFYYAGHGAQLDWRNYLLPVDALVETREQMKQRCVDLSLLLGKLSAGNDKTFLVILDACRNNPFGNSFLPEQKGLSQFDAPAGSLLAYATSPGNVASDGSSGNGLYTENLVRELSKSGTRIEDALKRVRLNVRLASHGEQIPWETTSLEDDVFLFNEGQRKLTESEMETLVELDVAEWTRIKSSHKIDDWIAYLRAYPNGRFAEIAQVRLTRLLMETEKQAPAASSPATTTLVPAAPAAAPDSAVKPTPRPELPQPHTTPAAPKIDIRAGVALPGIFAPSANPFSKGRYPLGRIFTVGDIAIMRQTGLLTDVEKNTIKLRVTQVDYDQDRVEFNRGFLITDLMGNTVKTGAIEFDTPVQWTPAEFQLGKKWTAAFRRIENGKVSAVHFDMQIVKRETVTVIAGKFDTFKIEGRGWNTTLGKQREVRLWLVPGLNFPVMSENITHDKQSRLQKSERRELVSLLQQNTGIS